MTMRSISLRCSPVKDCARAGAAAGTVARSANSAATNGRETNFIGVHPLLLAAERALRWLQAGEIVGFDPAGRSDRKARPGARGDFTRGLEVAAHEGRLRGGEIGVGQVVLEAVGHRQLAVGVGRFRLTR